MKLTLTSRSVLIASVALLGGAAAVAKDDAPVVPESLKPPPGETLKLKLIGTGVQIYQCQDGAWKLQGPDAKLTDSAGHVVGKHYAGPSWESTDGSKVTGEVKAHEDGPDPHAIAWLLLHAKSVSGNGMFGNVGSIQRLQTSGGQAPQQACAANQTVQVPYTANYYFYAAT
jgi:Protein of unknown function (DUF3455)